MLKITSKYFNIILILIIVIGLLIFFKYFGILTPIQDLLKQTIIPVQEKIYSWSNKLQSTENKELNKKELIEQNELLKKDILNLTQQISQLKIFEQANKELVKQLDFLDRHPSEAVTARIIGKTPDYTASVFIINRGSRDGLQIGLPVIAEEGVLIGKIITTTKTTAQVIILTDSHSKVAATVQNKDKTVGLVEGQHGLSLQMNLIPLNEKITPNNLIITSGLEPNIPAGLLIGQIDHLITQPNDVFQSAIIKPLINFDKVTIVTILIPPNNENQ